MSNTRDVMIRIMANEYDRLKANEPSQAAGSHPSAEVHERVGAAWAEWDKQVSATLLVLQSNLLANFLEARELDCVLVPKSKLRADAIDEIISADRHFDACDDRMASAAEEVIMYLTESGTRLASEVSAEQSLTEPPW